MSRHYQLPPRPVYHRLARPRHLPRHPCPLPRPRPPLTCGCVVPSGAFTRWSESATSRSHPAIEGVEKPPLRRRCMGQGYNRVRPLALRAFRDAGHALHRKLAVCSFSNHPGQILVTAGREMDTILVPPQCAASVGGAVGLTLLVESTKS